MISYTVTVYNEYFEINRLLQNLKSFINTEDEIVVVQTYSTQEDKEKPWFLKIAEICQQHSSIYRTFHFQNKFSDLKNYTTSLATKSYIINLDADELVSFETIKLWKEIIFQSLSDIYYVPRINTVENYTLKDIKKYNWLINNQQWINWPDYQPRIFKNNKNIQWVGDVHERLEGSDKTVMLPIDPRLAIIHHKDIVRQRQQNLLYETIITKQE